MKPVEFTRYSTLSSKRRIDNGSALSDRYRREGAFYGVYEK
jgi:hypothetical protein